MTCLPSGLYGMADATFGDPVVQAHRLVAGGCRVLQLRCKGWSSRDRFQAASAIIAVTRAAGAMLILNDDVACAAAVEAGGVHLGQGDGPIAPARAVLPEGAVIGRSTHDDTEIAGAIAEGADYIGFGPVFTTSTKETGFSAQGIQRLEAACRTFPGPVVAIGGITPDRLAAVEAAGTHAWAVGSGIWQAPHPGAAIACLLGLDAVAAGARGP